MYHALRTSLGLTDVMATVTLHLKSSAVHAQCMDAKVKTSESGTLPGAGGAWEGVSPHWGEEAVEREVGRVKGFLK